MKVLIVDDDATARKLLRLNLERHGCETVIEACDGQQGLELARAHKPYLIISDALMPHLDGFQFLHAVKTDPETKDIPFVFHSSVYTGMKDEQLAFSLGAAAFIPKPKEPEEFWGELSTVMEGIEAGKEKRAAAEMVEEEREYLKEYSQVVAAKLEEKVRELEEALDRRRKAEEELRESEQFLNDIVENIPDMILVKDAKELRFLRINRAGEELLGLEREELYGKNDYDLFPTADADFSREKDQEALSTGCTLDIPLETIHTRQKGTRLLHTKKIPILDRQGTPLYLLGISEDVTLRREAEEKIKRQMENLAALRMIDTAINSSLDLRITLNVLLQQTIKQLRVDAACVLLFSPHSQMLEYASGQGFLTDRISSARVRLGEGFAGGIALERKIRVIPEIIAGEEPAPKTLLDHEGFKAYVGVPLIAKGQVKGVLEIFHRTPLHPGHEWLEFAEALAGQAAIALDNDELFEHLQRSHTELLMAYDTTIEGWSRALDYRDRETEGHSRRVTEMAERLAQVVGMTDEEIVHVRRGALLHDIGKLGVPDNILLKAGALTDAEKEIMKKHPDIAYKLLAPIPFLRAAVDIPYSHHEKWDGSGYPRGLAGKEIPLAARVFAVVDIWDALRSDRPYRHAWPQEAVREYIESEAGKSLDPEIVDVFLTMEW